MAEAAQSIQSAYEGYFCKACEQIFSSRRRLQRHVERQHQSAQQAPAQPAQLAQPIQHQLAQQTQLAYQATSAVPYHYQATQAGSRQQAPVSHFVPSVYFPSPPANSGDGTPIQSRPRLAQAFAAQAIDKSDDNYTDEGPDQPYDSGDSGDSDFHSDGYPDSYRPDHDPEYRPDQYSGDRPDQYPGDRPSRSDDYIDNSSTPNHDSHSYPYPNFDPYLSHCRPSDRYEEEVYPGPGSGPCPEYDPPYGRHEGQYEGEEWERYGDRDEDGGWDDEYGYEDDGGEWGYFSD